MNILVIGISHHKTPVELREMLSFPSDLLEILLPVFRKEADLDEIIILSTCNRMEIYATGHNSLTHSISSIKQLLVKYRGIPLAEFDNEFYIHHGPGAVRHLFRVASGLDSMVIGETQILGQVKEAYESALKSGCTGVVLNTLFQSAFSVAKNVRTTTNISKGSISVSSVAVQLAEKIFGDLMDKETMIIGAGETGELTLRHLIEHGVQRILVTNRNYERAVQLATNYHGEAVYFDTIFNSLEHVDILISTTSAPDIIIRKDEIQRVMKKRKYKPIFLIDLAVPRDIESLVNTVDNVYLYNIDDLENVVSQNIQTRQNEIEKCEPIIEEGKLEFLQWYSTLAINPILRKLNERMEDIRVKELNRIYNQLGEMTEEEKNKIELLTKRLANQFLHTPIEELKKKINSSNGYTYAEVLQNLFNLNDNGKSELHNEPVKKDSSNNEIKE